MYELVITSESYPDLIGWALNYIANGLHGVSLASVVSHMGWLQYASQCVWLRVILWLHLASLPLFIECTDAPACAHCTGAAA